MTKLLNTSLLTSCFLLLLSGTAHANMGPGVGVLFFSIILGVPALILLIIWMVVPNEGIRTVAKVLLLVITVLAVLATIMTVRSWGIHNTWQWHSAKAYMEKTRKLLASWAEKQENATSRYPIGSLDLYRLEKLLGYPLGSSHFDPESFRYFSADGATYIIQSRVYTRKPSWLMATPEGIEPEEPGAVPPPEIDAARWLSTDDWREGHHKRLRYWGTRTSDVTTIDDSAISHYCVDERADSGWVKKCYGGPGPDGQWFTEDDVIR